MTKMSQKKLKLMGVEISSTTQFEVLENVTDFLKNRTKFFISTPNPGMIVAAQGDPKFMSALNSADIALPDGAGLFLVAKVLRININERIPGRVMFVKLLGLAHERSLRVYLLGATPEINNRSKDKIKNEYKNIVVEGTGDVFVNNKGYFDIKHSFEYQKQILRDINKFKPDFLFVAFGFPKQEKWIYNHISALDIGGAMAIGGTLDTFSGKMALPPAWLTRAGLEWFWRLLLEPSRFGRILNAVILFPLLAILYRLKLYVK